MKRFPIVLLLLTSCIVQAVAASASPIKIEKVYKAVDGPAGGEPKDMMGSVSPKYLVGFINAGFSVLSKKDGREVQPLETQDQFWEKAFKNAGGSIDGKPYDPRIFYDPLTKRWFATCDMMLKGHALWDSLTPWILIAVSQDDDPTHPWKAVKYQAPVIVDNNKLGIDKFGIYITGITGSHGTEAIPVPVMAIPKPDLLWKRNQLPSLANLDLILVPNGPRMSDHKLSGIEGMFPIADWNAKKKPGDPEYFVNRYRKEVGGETMVQVRKLTWTSPTKAVLSDPVTLGLTTHYKIQPTQISPQPPLNDGLYSPGIRAGEARVVNAVVRKNSLWTVFTVEAENHVGALWLQIDLKNMKVVQKDVLTDPYLDIFFPSLNVDAKGNMGIGMICSSATVPLSIYVTGRLASDPPNTLHPLVRAVEGKYVRVSGANLKKPGQGVNLTDYSTVVMDPSDPMLFWTHQEAMTNPTMPQEKLGDNFATYWVAWRVGKK